MERFIESVLSVNANACELSRVKVKDARGLFHAAVDAVKRWGVDKTDEPCYTVDLFSDDEICYPDFVLVFGNGKPCAVEECCLNIFSDGGVLSGWMEGREKAFFETLDKWLESLGDKIFQFECTLSNGIAVTACDAE
jgi:hypothetical protein